MCLKFMQRRTQLRYKILETKLTSECTVPERPERHSTRGDPPHPHIFRDANYFILCEISNFESRDFPHTESERTQSGLTHPD